MRIRTVTVVGANGTMGINAAGIFASVGNAKVYMVCRDMAKASQAVQKVVKSVGQTILNLIPADYTMLVDCVAKSDLVFESVVENLEIKMNITRQIASALRTDAVACSGTSGLSITALAECFPETLRGRYFGVHMFNPPYSMTLCELIVTQYTNARVKTELKTYLENILFRSVVEVKDTPAFLANRIGFQFINEAMQYAEKFKDKGGIDYIDAILGPFTGRVMAPLTTADFVGLDVHRSIVDNIYDNTCDYAHRTFILPAFAQKLIDNGKLGRKVGAGLYKMEITPEGAKRLLVWDIRTGQFRDKVRYNFPFVNRMKQHIRNGEYTQAMESLIGDNSRESEICLHFLFNYIIYSLVTTNSVADEIGAADVAMATGFNWCPPLAMLEAFSAITDVHSLMKEKLDAAVLSEIDINSLLSKAVKSDYDYRRYFRTGK